MNVLTLAVEAISRIISGIAILGWLWFVIGFPMFAGPWFIMQMIKAKNSTGRHAPLRCCFPGL